MRILSIILLTCALFALYIPPVYAYLDPSTGSYIIQVIAGTIFATGAGIAYYWKKIVSRLKGKRDKDEK